MQLADSIHDLLGVLDAPGTAESLIDAAQTITLCARHQKTIIDEVLTFSKLDSNLLVLSLERAQIPSIIRIALKMFEIELENARIEASIKIDQSYHDLAIDYVLVDPSRLLQIIINFLTNSIKFTRDSSTRKITINLAASTTKPTAKEFGIDFLPPRKEAREEIDLAHESTQTVLQSEEPMERNIYIYIGVEDTGRGLTTDETKHLFQRFAQGECTDLLEVSTTD